MKIGVMKYNNYNDFELVIDGIKFNASSVYNGIYGHGAYTEYILEKRFGINVCKGGGNLLYGIIEVTINKKKYTISIGEHDHRPETATHFKNVIMKHMRVLEECVEEIKKTPFMEFEV